jgi:alkylation response protein AidB-like acyl-CoA dehydrogenase
MEGCVVPAAQRLGGEGQGFAIALSSLDSGRIGIAAQAVGIAQASYEAARYWASEREQFGQPIVRNQVIAHRLADMHTKIEAAKGLLLKAGIQKDEGESFSLEAATAKLFATEMACEVTDQAIGIFGGRGYLKNYPVERYWRDARATTIYEGTSDIQRLVIARNILKG